jgi:hypothetical protein
MTLYPYRSTSSAAVRLHKNKVLLFSSNPDAETILCPWSEEPGDLIRLEQIHLIVPHPDGRFTGVTNPLKPALPYELIHQLRASPLRKERNNPNI